MYKTRVNRRLNYYLITENISRTKGGDGGSGANASGAGSRAAAQEPSSSSCVAITPPLGCPQPPAPAQGFPAAVLLPGGRYLPPCLFPPPKTSSGSLSVTRWRHLVWRQRMMSSPDRPASKGRAEGRRVFRHTDGAVSSAQRSPAGSGDPSTGGGPQGLSPSTGDKRHGPALHQKLLDLETELRAWQR